MWGNLAQLQIPAVPLLHARALCHHPRRALCDRCPQHHICPPHTAGPGVHGKRAAGLAQPPTHTQPWVHTVTCTHPHTQHWDTPTLPPGNSHPQLPAGTRCTPPLWGGSPPLWGGCGNCTLQSRSSAPRPQRRGWGGRWGWSRLCCSKPGPRWKPPGPGSCPSPGERRGAAPADVAAAARTSRGRRGG